MASPHLADLSAGRLRSGGRAVPGPALPVLAVVLLVLIPGTAAAQAVIEGEVTAKKDGRVHVEYTLPEKAAPTVGDTVEFQVTMRGLAVAAGRGEVVEVDDGSLWARVEEGDPPFGAVARIQATGDREDVLDLLLSRLRADGCTPEMVDRYRPIAEAGNPRAQTNLGGFYYRGCGGLERDLERAFQLATRAAEQGQVEAMNNLYFWHLATDPPDSAAAYAWARRAAETGAPLGLHLHGVALVTGTGTERDEERGAELIRRAAEAGEANAQGWLGDLYRDGRGVPKDPREAVSWYRRAAEQDHVFGLHGLGEAYRRGEGVPKDLAEAERWLTKAADRGYPPAREALAELRVEAAPSGGAAPPEGAAAPSEGADTDGSADPADDGDAAGGDRWSDLVRYEAEMHCARTGPGYRDHEDCRVGITLPAGLRATDVIGGALWRVHSTEPATGPKELSCGIYSKADLAADDGIRTLAEAYRTYIEAPVEDEGRIVWAGRELEGAPRCLAGRKDGSERVTYSASCTDADDPLRSRTPSGSVRVEALFNVHCSVAADRFDEATDGPGLLDALRSFEIGPP